MADTDSTDAETVMTALDGLERLGTDEYIVAFGTDNRSFIATPNAYAAKHLPVGVLTHLAFNPVRKVTWASYGSQLHSWFFSFEMEDGTPTHLIGKDAPQELRQWIERVTENPDSSSALRVQLGDSGSFIAWAKSSWICLGLPMALEADLLQLSGSHRVLPTSTQGSFKSRLHHVVWHADGSYYIDARAGFSWHFSSPIARSEWSKLWRETTCTPSIEELSELSLVALDPHAPAGETFVFIKKQHAASIPPHVVHFYDQKSETSKNLETEPAVHDTRVQHLERKPEELKQFRWAFSKREGRPHRVDSWELYVKEGEKLKVWEDRGNNWYIVEQRGGSKGWVHGTWLAFCGKKAHKDLRSAYTRFQEDIRELLRIGQLRTFPVLRNYTDDCTNAACEALKSNSQIGICAHELQTLILGSGCYSHERLKEERVIWHPDRFARYCHPEHKEQLKASAEELFVLYGILMDMCSQQEQQQ